MKKDFSLSISTCVLRSAAILFFLILLLCGIYASAQSSSQKDAQPALNTGDKAKATGWLKEDKAGFVENKGQIKDQNGKPNKAVKYLLTMPGLNVQLRATGFSYDAYVEEVSGDGRRETGGGRQKSEVGRWETIGLPTSDLRPPGYEPGLPTTDLRPRTSDLGLQTTGFKYHRVDVDLQGTNPNAIIVSEEPLTAITNVFSELGSFENIHSYKKITYKDIYPGIDLEFLARKGTEKPIEYNFIVHAGADASQIKMHYNSGSDISLRGGVIKMKLAFGMLEEKIPASYTTSGEVRNEVAVQYKTTGEGSSSNVTPSGGWGVAFNVPSYDKTKTLVIDPTPSLVWGTYYGTNGTTAINGVTLDAAGNVYIVGTTTSTGNIGTAGAFQSAFSGGGFSNAFLAAFTSSGTYLWGTYYGVSGVNQIGGSVAVSGSFVYLAGFTGGVSVPATVGQTIYGGGQDGFIAQFNSATGAKLWNTYYGGSAIDQISSIAVAPDGSLYASGYTASTTAIATIGPAFNGTQNAFLAKFTSAGTRLWGTYYGGGAAATTLGYAVAVDASGNPYIAGAMTVNLADYSSFVGGASPVAEGQVPSGTTDAFLARFDAAGTLTWGRFYGGPNTALSPEAFNGIVIDNVNGFVDATGTTGNTSLTGIATPGAFQTSPTATREGMVVQFNVNGYRQWGTYLACATGATLNYQSTGIAIGNTGNVYVSGLSDPGTNVLATSCSYLSTFPVGGGQPRAGFIDKFSVTGTRVWGTYWGVRSETALNNASNDLAVDPGNNVYLGFCELATGGSGFSTAGAYQTHTGAGLNSGVLMKFNEGFLPTGFTVTTSILSPTSQSVCSLGLPQAITGNSITATNPAGFNTGIFFQWQSASATTGPWTDIVGQTFKDFTPPTGSSTTYYRRLIKANNGYCNLTAVDSSAVDSVIISANSAPTVHADGPSWYLCPSGSITLNGTATPVAPATISSYAWYTGGATVPSATTATFVPTNITIATIYTLKVTDNNGCIGFDQVTVTPVTANAGPAASFCVGSSGVQVGTAPIPGGSVSYAWTDVSGTPESTAFSCTNCGQPIASPLVVSTYQLTVTVTQKDLTTCNSTSNVTITPVQPPNGVVAFAGPDTTICKNTTTVIGTASAAGYVYSWTPSTYLSGTTIAQPTFGAGTTAVNCPLTYSVTATKGGCTFQDQMNVSVIDMDIDKGGQTQCGPTWASGINNSGNCSGVVYAWSLVSGAGTVVTTRNGMADAYLKATGAVGSSAVFNRTTTLNGHSCTSQNVTVQVCTAGGGGAAGCPVFSIVVLSSQTCAKAFAGQPLQLGTTGLSTADYNFNWSPANLVDNPTASTVNIVSTGQDTIVITITNKYDPTIICTASIPINNPTWALPSAAITDKYTCPGVGVQIGTVPVAGYVYAWTPATNLSDPTNSNPLATVADTSVYAVTVTDTSLTGGGCTLGKSMVVNVNTIGFDAGPNRAVCTSAIVTLGTTPAGAYTYSWSPAGADWQGGTGPTDADPQILFAGTSQTYTVIVTDPLSGCMLYDTVILSNSISAGTYAGVAASQFCLGGSTLIGAPAIAGATYSWSPATGLNNTTVAQPTASPTATTTYTVFVSYSGCASPITDTVTATLLTTTPFDFVNQTVCASTPTNIGLGGAGNPASIAGAASYSWSPSVGLSCTACASPNANPPSAITYTCVITFSNGCTLSDTVLVTPAFTAGAGPDAVICSGGSAVIGLPSVANVTYAWTRTSGTVGSVNPTNVAQPTANPSATSVYHLVATGTGPNAGCTVTDDIQVTVNLPSALTITGNSTICAGNFTTLGVTAVGNDIYQWVPTTGVASPTSSQTVITPPASQVYTLVQTDLATGCSSSQQVSVVVNPNPIMATGGTVSVCSNTGTVLPLTVTSPSGTYAYSWASTAFLSNPYIQNPITYTSTSAVYTATITDNASNCQLQVQSNVIVGACAFALNGNVYHDANGQTDNTVNATGSVPAIPSGLYASLVDGSNNIIATVLVNPNGSYSFTTVPIGNYSIVLSTNPAGSVTPTLPAGWDGTGSILGTGTGSAGATSALPVAVSAANVINANFGIEQPPVPNPQTYFILSAPYGSTMPLTGTGTISSPAALSGNDLEDGVKGAGSTFTVSDTSGLNGNQLLYNGSPVVPGSPITNYNPALLAVHFGGTAGNTNLSFDYSVTDAAGLVSPSAVYSITLLIPLPVNLLYFNAIKSGQSALLNWSTAQETGSNYFGIERNSGGAWVQIGKVAAAGNSSLPLYYSFTDNKPYPGFNDYRLRLMNIDGSATYSVIRTLNFSANARTTVMPNPVTNMLYVIDAPAGAELTLLDATGRVLVKRTAQANSESIEMSTFVRGFYFIEVRDRASGSLLSTFKVIKN